MCRFPAVYALTLPNLFTLIETIYLKIWVKPVLNNAKTMLSVGLLLLKTPLLQPPIFCYSKQGSNGC